MGEVFPAKARDLRDTGDKDRAIGKVFTILAAIRRAGAPVTLAQVVRRTGLPKSTVHRLLGEMLSHEVVSRDANRYGLGRVVRELATGEPDSRSLLRHLMKPLVIALHEQTRWLVVLGAPSSVGTVEVVDAAYGYEYSAVVAPEVKFAPLPVGPAGRTLLAHDPDLLATLATRAGPATATAQRVSPRLVAELARIRSLGIAVGEEFGSGLPTLAVPVMGPSARPEAVLAVSTHHRDRLDRPRVAHLLRQAKAQACRVLAGQRADEPWVHPGSVAMSGCAETERHRTGFRRTIPAFGRRPPDPGSPARSDARHPRVRGQ